MRSRHPAARVRNDTTHRADGSRQGQQIHVRHTEGQTQRAVPGTSSLAHVARIGTWSAGGPAFSRQALAAMHHEVGLISCPAIKGRTSWISSGSSDASWAETLVRSSEAHTASGSWDG